MNTEIKPQSLKRKLLKKRYSAEENEVLISYLFLRRCIGYLGIALPIVVIFVSFLYTQCFDCTFIDRIQGSLSDYHNTFARDVFVAFLCSISIFLFAYRGLALLDNIVATITGILGFIVALFPTTIKPSACTIYPCSLCNGSCIIYPDWVGTLHLICAATFIVLLGCFSYFIFTQPDEQGRPDTAERKRRIKIYRACGIFIFVCVGILLIYFGYFHFFSNDTERQKISQTYKVVLLFEWIAIWAFGFSWTIKGQAIKLLNDKHS